MAARPYVLMDGFPPKPLAASDASLQEVGLVNAAARVRVRVRVRVKVRV